jgi:hypothetical protein
MKVSELVKERFRDNVPSQRVRSAVGLMPSFASGHSSRLDQAFLPIKI